MINSNEYYFSRFKVANVSPLVVNSTLVRVKHKYYKYFMVSDTSKYSRYQICIPYELIGIPAEANYNLEVTSAMCRYIIRGGVFSLVGMHYIGKNSKIHKINRFHINKLSNVAAIHNLRLELVPEFGNNKGIVVISALIAETVMYFSKSDKDDGK